MTIDFIYTWTVLPRAHLQRVTYDRESLNTCIINMECTVKRTYNQGYIIQVIA